MSTTAPAPAAGQQHLNMYFSKETNTWRVEQEDGTELEYDATKGSWVPLVDEDLVKRQQAAYSIAGVDEEAPVAPVLARENKKRKKPEDYTSSTVETDISVKRGKSDNNKPPKSKNTSVFVTGLPLDTEFEELVKAFAKYGVLEEADDGEPKVKMYAKEDGSFSGEALVVYFKEDSVNLAVNLLDESELRLGDPSTVIRVTKADFSHKSTHDHTAGDGGEPKQRRVVDKKRATKRITKMQKKIYEWDDEDGFGPAIDPEERQRSNAVTRVVVLKHMFTPEDLERDASLLLDLKEDVRDECSTMGEVTNVVLYDKEKDGIMTVKFRDPISAQACVLKMNGRWFDKRQVEASLYTGKQRFQKSGMTDEVEGDGQDAERKRLDNFAQWLMTEGD